MAAGLTPLWGVEYDPQIAAVYRANIGDHIIVADVAAVDYAALPRVDWLHASPVCTRASVANAKATESDLDLAMAAATVRAVLAQQPQLFTLENVWGYRNFAAFRLILAALEQDGYMVHFDHVNAADFGVPQTRRRLLLRAARGLLPPLPLPVPRVGWYAALADLLPDLPAAKLAPWQLARLPEDLKKTMLLANGGYAGAVASFDAGEPAGAVTANTNQTSLRAVLAESRNSNQAYGDGLRGLDEPAPTVMRYDRPSHAPKAILFSSNGNYESRGDHHAAADAPALTVSGQALGRARAVLVSNSNNENSGVLDWRQMAEPSATITGRAVGGTRAVLVKDGDYSGADGLVMAAGGDPAFGVRSGRSETHRAILLDEQNYRNGSAPSLRDGADPSITLTAYSVKHPPPKAILIAKTADKFGSGPMAATEPAQTIGANEYGSKILDAARVVALSPRCLARLQSVPDWYELPAGRTLAAKVIGNMVPPLFMQRIAESMGA